MGFTTELMKGSDVRLLIKPDSDPTEIVALLHNAIESIESMPENIATSQWLGSSLHLVEPWGEDSPERIKLELQHVLDVFPPEDSPIQLSPLTKVIAGHIQKAIDSGGQQSQQVLAAAVG